MFEFRLVYQGLLKGNEATSAEKQYIRSYFHKQLVNLWRTKHPLRQRVDQAFIYGTTVENSPARVDILKSADANSSRIGMERLATNFKIGEQRFLPIVTQEDFLVCGLDILLLRRDFREIIDSGDLDNRIKTLIDALRIPKPNENYEGPENPLCCVMEDDRLVSEIRVVGDYLFADPEQIVHSPKTSPITGEYKIRENHVITIVHVTVKATRHAPGNVEFL